MPPLGPRHCQPARPRSRRRHHPRSTVAGGAQTAVDDAATLCPTKPEGAVPAHLHAAAGLLLLAHPRHRHRPSPRPAATRCVAPRRPAASAPSRWPAACARGAAASSCRHDTADMAMARPAHDPPAPRPLPPPAVRPEQPALCSPPAPRHAHDPPTRPSLPPPTERPGQSAHDPPSTPLHPRAWAEPSPPRALSCAAQQSQKELRP